MGIEGYYEDYFDDRQQNEKLTNFQRIKSMSLDEMAEFINNSIEHCEQICISSTCAFHRECISGIKQWLQEESEE